MRYLMLCGAVLVFAACSAPESGAPISRKPVKMANEEYVWNCSGMVIRTGANPSPPQEDCVLVSGGGEH